MSGFIVTSIFSYTVARYSLTDRIVDETLPLISENIYLETQNKLDRHIVISSQMAQDTFVQDWIVEGEKDSSRIEKYLATILQNSQIFTVFFISDITKRYYHPNGQIRYIDQDNVGDKWYFKARSQKRNYDVIISEDEMNDGVLSVFINFKIYNEQGDFLGITGVGLSLDNIQKLLDSYQDLHGRRVYIVNKKGVILFHSMGERLLSNNAAMVPPFDKIQNTTKTNIAYENNGKTVFLSSRYDEKFQWYLIVEEDESYSNTPILKTLLINLSGAGSITIIVLFLSHLTINGYQKRLEQMATVDHLTKAMNRHAFDLLFSQEIKKQKRQKNNPLSVVMFDIDHFKSVNDKYGHQVGDEVLAYVSGIFQSQIRSSDVLCRWGGEEFIILLPNCDKTEATKLANEVRRKISESKFLSSGGELTITVSGGVAEYLDGDEADNLLFRSDKALYQAKENGRNKIEISI
ncbi:MAG: diguanylate cyclase [Alphaproteobacteria bacterium]|nr:diguanylate cyclase [Alphaproteobacteria bacterium]